jgi:iron(III) transport system substrate-binding protein
MAMVAGLLLALAATAHAQPANEAQYLYRGADRESRILEGARREGTLVLYTSLAPSESGPLAQAFEKKYGIRVELWRSNSEKVSQRTITEARGGRHEVDAVETIGTDLEKIVREKIFAEFWSPHLADLIPTAIPVHRAWMPDRLLYLGVGYNTRLVRREDLPATYEGFLDSKWKGQLALEAGDAVWLAGIVKAWGEARAMRFINRLARQRPGVRNGHTLLTQLIISGEVPVGLTVYSSGVEPGKRAGAPIDWAPVQPVIAYPIGIGLARRGPHPHAALLFADFVLSPEGQALFTSLGRPPASRKVQTTLGQFESVMMDPAAELDENEKWERIWKALFLNR